MNLSSIILFLKELAVNNNREWFHSQRDEYEKVQVEFENFLSIVISRMSFFDETIKDIQAKDCVYRIYRDIRFSSDKTPYKTHLGGFINAKGKKSNHSGYYIHLEPGNCLLAGGSICMPSGLLKTVRQAIYENVDEYISIVEDPVFKKYFPTVGENFLKTAPKGFPKEFKYIDYLKCKDYSCSYNVADEFFLVPETEMLSNIESVFRQLKRFMDFVNYTIDNSEE
jgi:uncharacterized protein (TIGR02453 family)